MNNHEGDWSMIYCPVCKRKIANDAEICPGCGHKITESDRIVNKAVKSGMDVKKSQTKLANICMTYGVLLFFVIGFIICVFVEMIMDMKYYAAIGVDGGVPILQIVFLILGLLVGGVIVFFFVKSVKREKDKINKANENRKNANEELFSHIMKGDNDDKS